MAANAATLFFNDIMSKKLTAVLLLSALVAAAADPEKLKKVADDAITLVKEQEGELESATSLIDELETTNEKLKVSDKNYRPEVTVAKDKYRVNHGINLGEGKILTIAELAKDLALVKKLGDGDSTAVSKLAKPTE